MAALEAAMAAREAGNRRTTNLLGYAVDRLGICRRGDRKPGLDDVHAERIELARQTKLFGHPKRKSRCLLAVTQRRVEDSDMLCHQRPLRALHWTRPGEILSK